MSDQPPPDDMLICDVNLPKVTGFAIAHHLETRHLKLKVMFIPGVLALLVELVAVPSFRSPSQRINSSQPCES